MPDLAPGDRVVIEVGRHKGGRAVVVSLSTVPTPSGGRVSVVLVRRPRAGDTILFPTDVRLETEPRPPAQSLPVGFGGSGFEE